MRSSFLPVSSSEVLIPTLFTRWQHAWRRPPHTRHFLPRARLFATASGGMLGSRSANSNLSSDTRTLPFCFFSRAGLHRCCAFRQRNRAFYFRHQTPLLPCLPLRRRLRLSFFFLEGLIAVKHRPRGDPPLNKKMPFPSTNKVAQVLALPCSN